MFKIHTYTFASPHDIALLAYTAALTKGKCKIPRGRNAHDKSAQVQATNLLAAIAFVVVMQIFIARVIMREEGLSKAPLTDRLQHFNPFDCRKIFDDLGSHHPG